MDPLTVSCFLACSSFILLVSMLIGVRSRRVEERIEQLSEPVGAPAAAEPLTHVAESTLPFLGKPLLPSAEKERTLLKTRLIHAGLYRRQALSLFLGVKMVLIFAPVFVGLMAGLSGVVPIMQGCVFGLLGSTLGIIGPGLWLDYLKARRQTVFRRALPDALDIMVLCLDGGLSLQGTLQRVSNEIRSVYPLLADEMDIVQREMHLGQSPGEALRSFANRADLEELRSLASVILQSERLGASLGKALHVHAESLRLKRLHRAEELAYTAGTRMLIPLILFIFPAILYVVAGPAMFHIAAMLTSMGR